MRLRAHWGLSSGQTIGAARTAVRSACCLPELRVANRLRRLYPLDTCFPTFPPAPLRIANRNNRASHRAASSPPAPESARQAPPKGNFSRQSCRLSIHAGGFPRGKQSARRALPCVPLVVCLNSGSLTAFGGCIHWIPASLRSPLHPFGSPTETIERLIGLQVLLPRRSRRVKPRQRGIFHGKVVAYRYTQGAFLGANNRRGAHCRASRLLFA